MSIQFKRRAKNSTTSIDSIKLLAGLPLIDLKTNTLYIGTEDDSNNKIKIDSTINKTLYTYKPIGKITSVGPAGVLIAQKGDDITTVLDNIFEEKKTTQPNITQPTVTLDISSTADDEYGTEISSLNYSVRTTAGFYTYGPATDVTFSNFKFSGGCVAKNNSATSGTLTLSPTYTVGITQSPVSIICAAMHSQGAIAKDNNGDNSNPVKRISSGTVLDTKSFSESATTYAYYATTTDTNIPTSRTRGSTSLSNGGGLLIGFKKDQYIWIITTKSSGKILNYMELTKSWTDTLGGTELPIAIDSFTQDNGYTRTYYAYRTKNTMNSSDELLIRFQ